MQRGRGDKDDFFGFGGDPFSGFWGFGGRPGSLISNVLGGREPFDDPFFTQPFGSMMGPSMFGPSMFGGSLFGGMNHGGFIEEQPPQSSSKSKSLVIEELSDDVDNDDNKGKGNKDDEEKNYENPRKHLRSSKEPIVQDPDEESEEKKSKHVEYRNDFNRASRGQPQARTFSFSSSSVTYGGLNGAYYTSSRTKRTGGDGVTIEESKEADAATGRATHRISRGLREKGHSVTRKLNSDGRVNTMQLLHNLNEGELAGFNEAWKGSAREHLPGFNQGFDMLGDGEMGSGNGSGQKEQLARGWTLPSAEQAANPAKAKPQPRPNFPGGRGI